MSRGKSTTMNIWLIAGYAGSGKSLAGEILYKLLSPTALLTAFAARVKDDVAELYKIPRQLLETQEGKASIIETNAGPQTARTLLIDHSARMKRVFDTNIWASYVADAIDASSAHNVVLHDWRFIAEYDTLVRRFPNAHITTIRIIRHSVHPMNIPSERELDEFATQHVISNNETVDDLRELLEFIICC